MTSPSLALEAVGIEKRFCATQVLRGADLKAGREPFRRIRAAVVEFGGYLGIGTRKIAVDWSAFRFAHPTITVAVSRDQLRATPEFKAERPVVVTAPEK